VASSVIGQLFQQLTSREESFRNHSHKRRSKNETHIRGKGTGKKRFFGLFRIALHKIANNKIDKSVVTLPGIVILLPVEL